MRLRCTLADFDKLDPAEETQFLPGTPGYPGYDPEQVLYMPYCGTGMGMAGAYAPLTVTYDAVPLDEVEVRRGEHVHATDGHIGKVQGLVIDSDSRHVTHVLLQEGHLWGRKEVAIPIGAVAGVNDGIRLNITVRKAHRQRGCVSHSPGVSRSCGAIWAIRSRPRLATSPGLAERQLGSSPAGPSIRCETEFVAACPAQQVFKPFDQATQLGTWAAVHELAASWTQFAYDYPVMLAPRRHDGPSGPAAEGRRPSVSGLRRADRSAFR